VSNAGVVEEIDAKKTLTVKFMQRAGSKFHWPTKDDKQRIGLDGILCVLKSAPRPCTNRQRQFVVDDYDFIETLKERVVNENG
jgi:hypothetical protein